MMHLLAGAFAALSFPVQEIMPGLDLLILAALATAAAIVIRPTTALV